MRSPRRVVRFGVFEVDLNAGELFKQGIKIRIQQQPFRVLALLLERPGEVVTREELRQAIWPAGTFVEFDVGLDAAIHKLRSALGDSAENPRLVETLPRRGYRLIAAVDSVVAPEAPRRRGRVATIIASAVSLAAIAALWHPWNRHTANSVAVLYFSARDTADAYLADGLTEDVTSLLGSVANVQVKSPGVVRRAQSASPGDVPAIARTLGVHYLLDGNVRRAGARVRVSVRLLTGATADAVWGDVFDRSPDELLALPSEIAQAVAMRVGGGELLGTLRTRSPAAYDHYLRGNFFLARRSPDQTARALAEYREAERLDSGFAAAIGRAAYAHAIARGNYYRLPDAPIESLAVRGLVIANRALRRDSTSSDAWMARGYLLAFANPRTMDGSVQAFQRSIALDPKNAEAHHQYGSILNWLGRHDEADREQHLALALDPGRAISFVDLAWTHVRDTALAVALTDSAVALDPASAFSRRWRALARLWGGDVRGAQEDAELANRLQPGDIVMESVLAIVLAHAGDSARARALMAHWPGRNEHWLIMAALVAVGDTAGALDRLERASPVPYLWAGLRRPEFDALQGNPRYERLLATLRPAGALGGAAVRRDSSLEH